MLPPSVVLRVAHRRTRTWCGGRGLSGALRNLGLGFATRLWRPARTLCRGVTTRADAGALPLTLRPWSHQVAFPRLLCVGTPPLIFMPSFTYRCALSSAGLLATLLSSLPRLMRCRVVAGSCTAPYVGLRRVSAHVSPTSTHRQACTTIAGGASRSFTPRRGRRCGRRPRGPRRWCFQRPQLHLQQHLPRPRQWLPRGNRAHT